MQRSFLRLSRNLAAPSAARSVLLTRAAAVNSTRQLSYSRALFNETKKAEAAEAENPSETEAAELSPLEKELKELKEKLAVKDKEAAEFKDRYVRSVADFRNLQETTKREIKKAQDYALQKFARDLIESVDNFGHALSAVKEDSLKTNQEILQLYDGVKMTRDIFEKTLTRHGMKKIDPLDEPFDPNRHEATFETPQAGKEPGTVFFVQQPGFELNGRVLRAAKVGIVKGED